jgi:hypothetical protein
MDAMRINSINNLLHACIPSSPARAQSLDRFFGKSASSGYPDTPSHPDSTARAAGP